MKVTGELSGTPTQAGSAEFVVKAEDAAGNIATRKFSLPVTMEFNPGMVFVLGGKLPPKLPVRRANRAGFLFS
jgi:hypothetical protein